MRIKRGLNKKARHNRVLELTKGYRGSYSKLYRRAREAVLHAGQYNYAHRQARPAQFRKQWIKIISAGLSGTGVSYNGFVSGLDKKNIELDRKVLADIAQSDPKSFSAIVEMSR